MKAIIMAAGKGTRISRHINNIPKCLVEITKESTLIKNTVSLLKNKGIQDIVIITGYKNDMIEEELKGFDIKWYYNPFYDVTNSLGSLWLAQNELKDENEIILMNGDVFLEESLLEEIMGNSKDVVIFSDSTRIEEADYRLYYENNKLVNFGKELTPKETTGEYIGVIKFSHKEYIEEFIKNINLLLKEQKHFLWWENAVFFMSKTHDVEVRDVKGKFWAEVDFIEDYQRILEYIKGR